MTEEETRPLHDYSLPLLAGKDTIFRDQTGCACRREEAGAALTVLHAQSCSRPCRGCSLMARFAVLPHNTVPPFFEIHTSSKYTQISTPANIFKYSCVVKWNVLQCSVKTTFLLLLKKTNSFDCFEDVFERSPDI